MVKFVNSAIKRFHLKEKISELTLSLSLSLSIKINKEPRARLSIAVKNESYFPLFIGK